MNVPTTFLSILAEEYHCDIQDFAKEENTLTFAVPRKVKRAFSPDTCFFGMITMGAGAVITADKHLHDFLKKFMYGRMGHWLFELPNLFPLEKELNRFGYSLTGTFHTFFLKNEVTSTKKLSVQWSYGDDILVFSEDDRFSNVIFPHKTPNISVCAHDDDRMMGIASATEDAPHFMQIGVDVLPKYRSQGVGTALVTFLGQKILQNGDIPYYMTSAANCHSWNLALNAGFRPIFAEIGAVKLSHNT